MSEPKRLALAGVGGWGRNVARGLRALRGAVLRAVCDPNPAVLAAQDEFGAETLRHGDFNEILADRTVDAVLIATPAETHAKLALEALGAGKDVFVEKPLALSAADASEIARRAEAGGRVLMVGHLLLYHPAVVLLRDIVARGELGEIRYLASQRLNLGVVRTSENALWSLAPHDVAVALHLLEEEPHEVTAQGAAYVNRGIEDVAFLQLRFRSGRMAAIHVSWLDPNKERRLTIVGSRKMAVLDDMEATEKLRIYDKGVDRPDYVAYGDALSLRSGDIWVPKVPAGEPLALELQHFVDRLHDRARPRSDGAGGLAVVRVLAAASESLRRGGALVSLQ